MIAFPGTRHRLVDFPVGRNRLLALQAAKWCNRCRAVKPVDDFPRNRANRDGRASICRVCDGERLAAAPAAVKNARHKRWRDANAEHFHAKAREWQSNRRARVRGAFVEYVDPAVVFERDEGICGICTEPVPVDQYDVDHIVPLAEGGEHSYANVQVAHVFCNRSKGGKLGAAITNAKELV